MKLEVRYSNHPKDVKHYTTDQLREHFLIPTVFVEEEINLVYSHNDRIIAGGAMPIHKRLHITQKKDGSS